MGTSERSTAGVVRSRRSRAAKTTVKKGAALFTVSVNDTGTKFKLTKPSNTVTTLEYASVQ